MRGDGKGLVLSRFCLVLSAVWALLGKLAWRPFDLEQVFIGVERFPVNVLFGEIACAGNAI